jgi:hypothetical protein
MKLLKFAGVVAIGLALAYGIAGGALYLAMRQPPETFGAIMSRMPMTAMTVLPFEPLWMSARQGSLRVGDTAPDFSLPAVDRTRVVTLSAATRERPVVLIFGSYT